MEQYERGRRLESSWGWLEFAARLPSRPVPFTALAAATQVFKGRCVYQGITGINNATVGGGLALQDGEDSTGLLVGRYGLTASNSFNFAVPNVGTLCEIGLWLNPLGVNVTGSVYVIPLWHYERTAPGE